MPGQSLSIDVERNQPAPVEPANYSEKVAGPYQSVEPSQSKALDGNKEIQENRYQNQPTPARPQTPAAPAGDPPAALAAPDAPAAPAAPDAAAVASPDAAVVVAKPYVPAYQAPAGMNAGLAKELPPARPKLGGLELEIEQLQIENGKIKFFQNKPDIREAYRDPDTRAAFLDSGRKCFSHEGGEYLDKAYALEDYPRDTDPEGYLAELNYINREYVLQYAPTQVNLGTEHRDLFDRELAELNDHPARVNDVNFISPTTAFSKQTEVMEKHNDQYKNLISDKDKSIAKFKLDTPEKIQAKLDSNQIKIDNKKTELQIQKDSSKIVDLDAQIKKESLIATELLMKSTFQLEKEAGARARLIGNHIPDLDDITNDPVANDLFIKHLALKHTGIDNSFLVPVTTKAEAEKMRSEGNAKNIVPPKTQSEIARRDLVMNTFTQSADFKKYRALLPTIKNDDQKQINTNNALIKSQTVKSPTVDAIKAERSQLAAKNALALKEVKAAEVIAAKMDALALKELKAAEVIAAKMDPVASPKKGFFGRLFSRK